MYQIIVSWYFIYLSCHIKDLNDGLRLSFHRHYETYITVQLSTCSRASRMRGIHTHRVLIARVLQTKIKTGKINSQVTGQTKDIGNRISIFESTRATRHFVYLLTSWQCCQHPIINFSSRGFLNNNFKNGALPSP